MKSFKNTLAYVSRFWLLAASLLMTTAFLSSCDDDDDDTNPQVEQGPTLAERLQEDDELSTLALILSQPAYEDLMMAASNAEAELTIFAPTNAAFNALVTSLGLSSATALPEEVVREVLEYHIVPEVLMAADITAGNVTTLQGESLMITTNSGGVQVNGTGVIEADIEAENGVIHKIGGVLLPAEPAAVAGTVLAPAYFNADFSILVEALRTAGLVETLLQDGPYTVFAPTNDAFAAAGITSLDGMTAEDLTPVLLYHVLGQEVMASALSEGPVMTLAEKNFWVSLNDNGAFINGNTAITATDVAATNGVVHVIDRTLMPPMQNLVEIVQSMASMEEGAEFTQLLAAVLRVSQNGGSDLVSILSGTNNNMGFTVFAPTDAAFQAVYDADNGINNIDDIPVATLEAILLTHVTGGRVFSTDLEDGTIMPLQDNQTLVVDASVPSLSVQGSNTADILPAASNVLATNGVIHVIDEVLMPAN